MHVFIAGSTGVLGPRLVDELTDRGHDVVGLVRDEAGAETVANHGGDPRRGDVLDRDSLVDAAQDADVVVHAATAIPTSQKPTDDEWARNDRVRVEGARNLAAVAEAVGADRLLFQSVVWVARQPDGSVFDESATPQPDRTTRSALEAERLLTEAAREGDFDTSILRGGWYYAHDTAHTRQMARELLGGNMPIVGGGLLGRQDARLSFVHVDDAARAFADAATADSTGLWHVVDDEPTPFADFVHGLADRLDADDPRRVPAWLAKFLAGDDFVRLVTNPMPTHNDAFCEDVGWEPRYPTIEAGLDAVVETWRENGTLVATNDGYEWRDEM